MGGGEISDERELVGGGEISDENGNGEDDSVNAHTDTAGGPSAAKIVNHHVRVRVTSAMPAVVAVREDHRPLLDAEEAEDVFGLL